MDNFVNLAKQGYQAYQNSGNDDKRQQGQGQGGYGGEQQGFSQGGFGGQQQHSGGMGGFGGEQQLSQGGAQFNQPHGSGGSQGGFGGFGRKSHHGCLYKQVSKPDVILTYTVDQGAALGSAQAQLNDAGMQSNDSGLSGMFAQGLAMAQSYGVNKNPQDVDLDGDGVIDAHERAYNKGQGGQMDANSMGAAAAMQAMKSFMGNGGGSSAASSSGGNMQSKLIGMAMAEAVKLFNKNGGAANGSQQDVVSSASTTIMKLMLKSQMSGAMGTGGGAAGGSGGMGSLLSMASLDALLMPALLLTVCSFYRLPNSCKPLRCLSVPSCKI
ncbi:hypothetical protein QFC19_008657 [Naganishia cerealis]|uniref:Uncharacterized protein n=1 Tax=Naganishia cerealis TaxID=610337 RepID=A0ACC2UZV8_9TREE|nr:hypothetical protein QFC19_008657 [Naganishia cerealis]